MATIKSYTDLSQSKTLSKILPLESADMWYSNGDPYKIAVGEWKDNEHDEDDVPCWSLASLLEPLPYSQLSKDKLGSGKEGWMVSVYPNDCRYDSCWHDNPIDVCVNIIEKLYELKML